MKDTTQFRSLIVASLLSLLGGIWFAHHAPVPNEEVQYLYRWSGFGAVVHGRFGQHMWHLWLAFTLGGLVGSFFFLRVARPMLILPLFISIVRAGLGGIYVSFPAEEAVFAVYYLFSTLVLGMALYSEPIRAAFRAAAFRARQQPD